MIGADSPSEKVAVSSPGPGPADRNPAVVSPPLRPDILHGTGTEAFSASECPEIEKGQFPGQGSLVAQTDITGFDRALQDNQLMRMVRAGLFLQQGPGFPVPGSLDRVSIQGFGFGPDTKALIGEVGLAGEVRPVSGLAQRLREAARLGFKRAVVSSREKKTPSPEGVELIRALSVAEALAKVGVLPA